MLTFIQFLYSCGIQRRASNIR